MYLCLHPCQPWLKLCGSYEQNACLTTWKLRVAAFKDCTDAVVKDSLGIDYSLSGIIQY